MASHSPIPRIQFAQSHCHLSEDKWEAEGRMGWKEKREACDSTVLLSQWAERKQLETEIQTDRQTDRQTEECRGGGKVPPVIERRDSEWQSQRGTKATLCPQEGDNYSSSEQLLKQRVGTGGREGKKEGWRLERNRTEQKGKPERSGQTGMSSARLSILSQSEKNPTL